MAPPAGLPFDSALQASLRVNFSSSLLRQFCSAKLAPPVGLEPTTNRLHVALLFPEGVDYIITHHMRAGCEALRPVPRLRDGATPVKDSL